MTVFVRYWLASLVLGGLASAAPERCAAGEDDDLSALLKRQTQDFSEAGQRGDAATMDRLLDPELVFTNEQGEVGTKSDVLESVAPPPPSAPKRRIEVTDWSLRRQGDVATATFVDEVSQAFQGQTLTLRFRSTETWAERDGAWRMIASQTMNVQRDPAARPLPASELDDYVGVYEVDPTLVVRMTRDGDDVFQSVNGAPPVMLKAEVKDVLFAPGTPNVRKIFQRDAAGHVSGYVNRRDGVDLVFRKVG